MSLVTLVSASELSEDEVIALYDSVGWTTYTREPSTLRRALENSSSIAAARNATGELVGLARALSDGATICFVQDILVKPDAQGAGVGRMLLGALLSQYGNVRQTVLITDDEPGQRRFYEAMGFTEGADMTPSPLRMFALFR